MMFYIYFKMKGFIERFAESFLLFFLPARHLLFHRLLFFEKKPGNARRYCFIRNYGERRDAANVWENKNQWKRKGSFVWGWRRGSGGEKPQEGFQGFVSEIRGKG